MGLASRSENCCCCISVKAGTLVLLYLDLFAVIISIVSIFNGSSGTNAEFNINGSSGTYTEFYTYHRNTIGDGVGAIMIVFFVLAIIIIAGLFAVGKKKPSLLIPYFIVRIIVTLVVMVVVAPFLFLEKKGLDILETPKDFNKAYTDMTGDSNNAYGKTLDYASNALYVLIVVEILLIVLQIHYAKVVYACYKQIEEELARNTGIIYASQLPPSTVPYVTLPQQTIDMTPQNPIHIC